MGPGLNPEVPLWSRPPVVAAVIGMVLAGLLAAAIVAVSPLVALGAGVALIGGLFFLTHPRETLLAAIVFRVFLDILWWVPFQVGGLNLSQIFSGAVFAMLSSVVLMRLRELRRHPAALWAMATLGLLILAAARAIEFAEDIDILVRYLTTPLMILAAAVVFDSPAHRRRLIMLVVLAAVVPVLQSGSQLVLGVGDYVLHGYRRLLGGYQNIHNHALVMLCFSMLFLAVFQSAERRLVRWGALAMAGIALVAIYFTYTRTGLLGWAVSVLTALLVQRRFRLVGAAMLAGSVFVLFDPDVQDRFGDLLAVFDPNVVSTDRQALGSGRWGLWSWSMKEYLERPVADVLMGLGLGGHRLTTLDWSRAFHRVGLTLDPHNDYLLLLYQMGPLGVVAYLGMCWVTFRESVFLSRFGVDAWTRSFGAAIAGLTVGVLVTNAVSNSFIHRSAPGWYYWCFAGLVIAEAVQLRMRLREEARAKARPIEVPAAIGSGYSST